MIKKLSIDIINSLTLSELDTLRYMDNNKEKVFAFSIQKLAKSAFVSTATIMRLCKKLGFSGFAELKYYLKEEINLVKANKKTTTFGDILHQNIDSVVNTIPLIDESKVAAVVQLLRAPVNVHFFGKGLTSIVLEYGSKLLLSHTRVNIFYQDTHIAYLAAEIMTENDLVFVASLSGNTHQVVRMAQIAKSRGAKVVTITGTSDNALSKIGDYNFNISAHNPSKNDVDINSRIPILFVLNVILTTYLKSECEKIDYTK
ncbi:MAG: MurR/RpiR family transcriptional regulator [Endomicrobiaceae bacterium]|nr:MurR/RpiR family transcriptional regulator [Endomicrobiaceae bacterium]